MKELNEQIKKYRQNNPNKKLKDFINEELWKTLSPRTTEYNKIQWRRYEMWKELWKELEDSIEELNETVKKNKSYFIEDNNVIFYVKEWEDPKKIKVDIWLIKKLWFDYSKHWWNFTMEEILQKYWIQPQVFHLIKNRLRLYKASNAYPWFLLDDIPDDEQDVIVEEVIEWHIKDKFKKKYLKSYENKAKKALDVISSVDNLIDYINNKLADYNPKYIEKIDELHIKSTNELQDATLYVAMTDIHIGKKNTDEVLNRIKMFTEDMINKPEKDLTIFCLWDLAEILIEWWRHPWQIESMDWPFWFDLIMKVVDVLQEMIIKIYMSWKTVKFYWIAGNHWVLSTDKWWDVQWTWELIIYELIKRWIQNYKWLAVDYFNKPWVWINWNDFHFILNHWAGNHTSKKSSDILWEHWDKNKHNIILQWDKHHSELKDDSKNATKILVPAFAWENIYDKRLWLSSYTWYVCIKKTRYWTPETTFIRFNSN